MPPSPKPAPFRNSVERDGVVYLAGVIAQDGPAWRGRTGSIEEETAACLDLIAARLGALGLGLADVTAVTVHLSDLAEFDRMNAVYATRWPDGAWPARTCVGVHQLLEDAKLEITCVAHR